LEKISTLRVVFFPKTLTIPAGRCFLPGKGNFPANHINYLNTSIMQKSIFQKAALAVVIVTLLAFYFCCLQKMGVGPLAAAFVLIFLKGFIRFVFRITVILVSIAITVYLFITLLTCF
jgi:hypothetical protein